MELLTSKYPAEFVDVFLWGLCKLQIFVHFERAKKETIGVLIAAVAVES